MTTLQDYLNQKYPTQQDKEQLTDLNLEKISLNREEQGETELLEGGELDLTAFVNLEEIEIYRQFLKTSITKLNVSGLTNLKTLIWPDQEGDSEEEKKLWTELGITNLSTENNQKKKVVKEVRRLAELKVVKVSFYNASEEVVDGKKIADGVLEKKEDGSFEIGNLNLNRKDKAGNFCPSLVFWTLARELASISIGGDKTDKTPEFWKKFKEELEWVRDNLTENYQKKFELLLNPSTFPIDKLEIKELLTVYYPNAEEITDSQQKEITISPKIVDQTWQTIQHKFLELTDQELKNSPDEEKLPTLAFNLKVDHNSDKYSIFLAYHSKSPFTKELQELFTTTPLQLENELLKKEKEVLPTPENFERLQKQNQLLDNYLQDLVDEEKYQAIKANINKIE